MSAELRIAVVTPRVGRRSGGTERCMSWLVEDLSQCAATTLICASVADTDTSRCTVRRAPMVARPRLLAYLTFLVAGTAWTAWTRLVHRNVDVVVATSGDCLLTDVVYAHFCCDAWLTRLRRGDVTLPAATLRQRVRNVHYRTFLSVAARVERAIYRRRGTRLVIAVSSGVRREIIDHYGLDPAVVRVIPNAVDPRVQLSDAQRARYRSDVRQQVGADEDTMLALFVAAGDWKRKGLPLVLSALHTMRDDRCRVVVVGDDDIPHYRSQASRLGVEGQVVFAGSSNAVEHFYAAADVVVHPSWYEAFSLVSLEAAGAGLPLVATRTNGIDDLVVDGTNGFIVEPDPSALAAALRRLLDDPELRRRMGAAARVSTAGHTRAAVVERFRAACAAAGARHGYAEAPPP